MKFEEIMGILIEYWIIMDILLFEVVLFAAEAQFTFLLTLYS